MELLKMMKNKIDVSDQGTEIAAMRKTKSGEMLLEIKGTRDEAEALKGKIEEKVPGVNVRTKEKEESVVQIRDLDATVTEEEVKEALKLNLSLEEEEITVKSIREAYGENRVATVALPEEAAKRLDEQGRIKIGWLRCRVRTYVKITTCFKCWEVGHNASECRGPDRSQLCLKCGKDGHRAKNCQGIKCCPICNQQGHRAGSGSCPNYRKGLAAARQKNRRK